jgi:hypothetical protein
MTARAKPPEPIPLAGDGRADAPRAVGTRVGRVVSASAGVATIEIPGVRGTVAARVSAAIDDETLERAARDGQEAVLLFEEEDPARPLVVALLRSRTPHIDAILAGPVPAGDRDARVDGRTVLLEGHEEVVLRCGKASLTLRRDGTIVLRGVNVLSQAERVQKIRGGAVRIN